MNETAAKLLEERTEIVESFWNNKLPKRLPVDLQFNHHMVIQYSGLDVVKTQYELKKVGKETIDKLCDEFYTDFLPIIFTRSAPFYQLLGARSFQMSADGFIQHPEVSAMDADEYDGLIADPYTYLLENILPKQYTNLDYRNPIKMSRTIYKANSARNQDYADLAALTKDTIEKKGFYTFPGGVNGQTVTPCDMIAAYMRSFSFLLTDIRRNPEKVKQACEAIYPLCFRKGLPNVISPLGMCIMPLHMPPFMRAKDFENVYLPTFMRLCKDYASLNFRPRPFIENDWMRYLDYLRDLPAGSYLFFEKGDPKTIKEKLGDKFIIGGLYPLDVVKYGTNQQVTDKAKEILDIMMPGGGYNFFLGQNLLYLSDVKMDNLRALTEFLRDYAVYDNPGAPYGCKINSEGFTPVPASKLDSQYVFDWNAFKKENPYVPESSKARFDQHELELDQFLLGLFS